jgi:CRP/FNR family transcriptional regulator, cyclic AMP receptor protein
MVDWPLLESLDPEERRALLAAARRRRFGRREVLFHEGDPGDALHLIVAGRVAVYVSTPLGDRAILAVLEPGEFVGEMALVSPAAERAATARALEPTETFALRSAEFETLRRAHPAVDRFLVEVLAATVRRLNGLLLEALYVPADKRVMRRLASLAPADGTPVALTQEELAGLAGTARATANRALRSAEADGILRLRRSRIEILDHEALARRR